MSLSTRVLVALLLGLATGLVIRGHPTPTLLTLVSLVEPIGTLWVNAIRMTVVPLVVSLVITGVASSADMQVVRGIGLRALASFVGLLVFAGAVGLLVVPPLFGWLRIDAATLASVRAHTAGGAVTAAPSHH